MSKHRYATIGLASCIALLTACGGASGPGNSPKPSNSTAATNSAAPTGNANNPNAPVTPIATASFARGDGSKFTIADMPGKVRVVNVWATWCAPCIAEMPVLNKVAKKYESQGVSFLAVSVDENGPDDVEPALKRGKPRIDFPIAYATFDDLKPINVAAPIPDTLVFDAQGKLVKHFDKIIEEPELDEAIKAALGAGAK